MKLRTSFFKPVVLKKDILRYAPIWALYLIGMMLLLMENTYYSDYDRAAYFLMRDLPAAFGVVNICYAAMCAVMLFGDLYNTKLCYSLHAMPYRRESWLLTHLVSGLLFSLVPNMIACAYLMVKLEAYWFIALWWLLASTLQFIFFYGLATVSAMLTGHRFAMLLVYAGFNFVAMLLYAAVNLIYIPMLNGVVTFMKSFSRFSPVVYLFGFDFFQFTRKEVLHADVIDPSRVHTDYFYQYEGLGDGWGYLAILAAVGIAAMAISLWLYRKRHLESAGDFIAFPRLKGVACVIMTVCVLLCFALMAEIMGNGYFVWLSVGLIVGYFCSLMLLERRLKVFRKKTLLGFAAMAVAVVLSVCAIAWDWFGIESWTPNAGQVASVTVSNSSASNTSMDIEYGYGANNMQVTLKNQEDIEKIIAAHEDILSRVADYNGNTHRVTLVYKLKSGRTVVRSYRAPATGEGYEIVRKYLYTPDSVLGFTDAVKTAANLQYMYTDALEISPVMYEAVLKALQQDCAKGAVLPNSAKAEYYVEYSFEDADGRSVYRSLAVTAQAENFIALIKSPQVKMGYTDWEAFLGGLQHVEFDYLVIPQNQWVALMTAVRDDITAGRLKDNHTYDSLVLTYTYYEGGRKFYRELYITKSAQLTIAWYENYCLLNSK